MQLAELILAISAWCGNLTGAGIAVSGNGYTTKEQALDYSKSLNREIASCKKEILSCLRKLKPSQAEAAVECFEKVSLPK